VYANTHRCEALNVDETRTHRDFEQPARGWTPRGLTPEVKN
jgi:hypothetical protein